MKDVEAAVRSAAQETALRAAQHRMHPDRWKSFVSGEWQVFSQEHPAAAPFRTLFFAVAEIAR